VVYRKMWGANRRRKPAKLESIYEDVAREIRDAGLTPATRNKNRNLLASFTPMNELTGQLSVRITVQVKSAAPMFGHKILGVDMGKGWGTLQPGEAMVIERDGSTTGVRECDEDGRVSTTTFCGPPAR
jgi:hypothetical protein